MTVSDSALVPGGGLSRPADGHGSCSSGRFLAEDVIEKEEMMETFAAIVVAAVVVPLVLLGILLVEVLTGFILAFL